MADKKPGIDQALIRDLANILNDTDLTEIEVEQDDLRIRVSRAGTPQFVQAYQQPQAYQMAQPMAGGAPAEAAAAPVAAATKGFTVTAPMVGTCYMSPAPVPSPSSKWEPRSRKARPS